VVKKLFLTWDDFDDGVYAAIADYKAGPLVGKLKGVYGIPRGGVILAASLSHHLDIPLLMEPEDCCLIVDDILESGDTMQKTINRFYQIFPKGKFAAWVWVNKNPSLVAGYGRFESPEAWVVFPWEDWQKAEEDARKYELTHKV
jgi:hypoxanthine phosphoribosyltransferase